MLVVADEPVDEVNSTQGHIWKKSKTTPRSSLWSYLMVQVLTSDDTYVVQLCSLHEIKNALETTVNSLQTTYHKEFPPSK